MGKQSAMAIPKIFLKKVFRFLHLVSELIVRGIFRQANNQQQESQNFLKEVFRFSAFVS